MKDISKLQRHIGTYSKAREIYAQYRKLTGRKRDKFYEQHTGEITSCQAAKRYFDSLGLKKLPSMQSLKQEYAMLQPEGNGPAKEAAGTDGHPVFEAAEKLICEEFAVVLDTTPDLIRERLYKATERKATA